MTSKLKTLPVSARQLTDYAKKFEGTKESPAGSNRQPFGEDFGWNGVAWCGIFVYYCFEHVAGGVKLDEAEVLGGVKRSYASTDYMRARMKAAGWTRVTSSSKLRRGDVAFWQFGVSGSDVNHVSIVLSATSSTITSIDGNSGPSSENAGGEVSVRTRAASYMLDAYRPPYRDASKTSLKAAAIVAVVSTAGGLVPTAYTTITGKSVAETLTSASPTTTASPTASATKTASPTTSATKTTRITCYFSRELKVGSYGADVNRLRVALGERPGRLFTASTKAALKKRQKKAGVTADGELGKKTVKASAFVYKTAKCTWTGK